MGEEQKHRLPAEVMELATPEFIWQSVQMFLDGDVTHSFGDSTEFDLITDDGRRLPPKAVFGIALSLALGGKQIGPKHFSGGESSTCFRLLRAAGYRILPKNEMEIPLDSDVESSTWAEGDLVLVSHMKRERAKGLANAKKAQCRRVHGVLICERCGLDPVAHYKTPQAESCIEVHHATTHVRKMMEGHRTTLNELECLCANCHRLEHRLLRDGNR